MHYCPVMKKTPSIGFKRELLAMALAGAASALFGWTTRPGWPGLPSQDARSICCALARGSASAPSAAFPLCEPGKPVPCWWDDEALHVGERVFEFAKLGIDPRSGAAFTVDVVADNGCSIKLKVALDENAAAYSVPDFGILGNQSIDLPVRITPKRKGAVRVFSNAVGARSPRFIRDKVFKVDADEAAEVRIAGRAPDSGNHIFDLYDADGTVLFMAFYPFHDPSVRFAFRTVISDVDKQILFMRVDQWLSEDDEFDISVRMKDYFSGADAGFSATKRLSPTTGMMDVPFDVSGLKPGTYRLFYDVKNAKNGEVVCSDYAYYAKPDGRCAWDDTVYGSEDSVPPPWTAPVFDADRFSVWNRRVAFGGAGLVNSIRSSGEELLASPIEVRWNDRPLAFRAVSCDRHVSYADYLLAAQGVPLEAAVRVEFDGLMVFRLRYEPPVERLSVIVPVRRDKVVGFDDCSDPTKKLVLPNGETAHVEYNPEQKPWWWIGSTIGLMGGIQNVRGWYCRNLDRGFSLDVGGRMASVAMHFVDEKCTAPGARTVEFYLQPTPVKPKNCALASLSRDELVTWTGYLSEFYEAKLPGLVLEERVADFRKKAENGKRVFFYNSTKGTSPVQPWWGWLGQDWEEYGDPAFFSEEVMFKNRNDRDRNVWVCGCLNSKSFRDYKIWSICWFLNNPKYGVKDLYFDLAGPSRGCKNRLHDCTWTDEFGRRHHDGALLSCREVHKRVYREMKKKNADSAMLGHLQYQRTPSDVFFDRLWMGETYDRFIRGTMSYYDVLNPEMMQIQYASRASEVVIDMIPQINRAMRMFAPDKVKAYDPHAPEHDRINRHATAYFKIHDLEVTPQDLGADQWGKPDAVLKAFGAKRQHRAYYHADCPVSVSDPNPRFIYACFSGNGQRLLVLLNDTDEEMTEVVSVKGVSSQGTDIFNGKDYDFSSGYCTIVLPPRESLFVLWK